MNRLILIGNGFDLAHKLPTSYQSFIDWFWKNIFDTIKSKKRLYIDNPFIYINNHEIVHRPLSPNLDINLESLQRWNEEDLIDFEYKNIFLKIITEKRFIKNWVDIEDEYYQQLKTIVKKTSQYYTDDEQKNAIIKLNHDFEQIKQELEKYLSSIEYNKIIPIKHIHNFLYDSFKYQDFPSTKENLLLDYITEILSNREVFYNNYYLNMQQFFFRTIPYNPPNTGSSIEDRVKSSINYLRRKNLLNEIGKDYHFHPSHTLLLNFNYTETESLYTENKSLPFLNIWASHIHGKLNNKTNTVIFGYGDELTNEYKEIERLNNNEYLKYVKSMKYLQSDYYKKLIGFINFGYYQIYIMGHSCGISDRTLLNTLFEHHNCVSIKPFYHEKTDGNGIKIDNYDEIIMNISRNFSSKKEFREKVVNKTYCEPLPQMETDNLQSSMLSS